MAPPPQLSEMGGTDSSPFGVSLAASSPPPSMAVPLRACPLSFSLHFLLVGSHSYLHASRCPALKGHIPHLQAGEVCGQHHCWKMPERMCERLGPGVHCAVLAQGIETSSQVGLQVMCS